MLEMTVIISAFPYTSIRYFTYHMDSFLELQALQNYSSDIFHIFRMIFLILNYPLLTKYFKYISVEILNIFCIIRTCNKTSKMSFIIKLPRPFSFHNCKETFFLYVKWLIFVLYNSIIIVNIYRSNQLNDKTHIFYNQKIK